MIEACNRIFKAVSTNESKKANHIIIPDNIAKLLEENEQKTSRHNR